MWIYGDKVDADKENTAWAKPGFFNGAIFWLLLTSNDTGIYFHQCGIGL
jgi:hypothetical protein